MRILEGQITLKSILFRSLCDLSVDFMESDDSPGSAFVLNTLMNLSRESMVSLF